PAAVEIAPALGFVKAGLQVIHRPSLDEFSLLRLFPRRRADVFLDERFQGRLLRRRQPGDGFVADIDQILAITDTILVIAIYFLEPLEEFFRMLGVVRVLFPKLCEPRKIFSSLVEYPAGLHGAEVVNVISLLLQRRGFGHEIETLADNIRSIQVDEHLCQLAVHPIARSWK